MVKRALFPLEILPLTKVLYHLFNHLIAVGIALPLLIALWGAKISWHLFWMAGVIVALTVFTLATTFWIATAGVFFRGYARHPGRRPPDPLLGDARLLLAADGPTVPAGRHLGESVDPVHRRRADGRPRRPGAVGSPARADGALGVHRVGLEPAGVHPLSAALRRGALMTPVIECAGVSKAFILRTNRQYLLKERALGLLRPSPARGPGAVLGAARHQLRRGGR